MSHFDDERIPLKDERDLLDYSGRESLAGASPLAASEERKSEEPRASFAATLWNPLSELDKKAFNRRRLLQLAVGVLVAMTAGSSYAFGIFSNKIKASAGFSQSDMTTITTIGSLLYGFTFPGGVLYDYAGPQYVLGVATALSCAGFILLALIFQEVVPASVYSVAAANGLTNWGAGFTDCGSLMTNLFNLPINRGEIMIIQKTFFGLGSTFLSLCFDGFFGASDNYLGYAIFVCVLIFVTGSLGAAVTRLPTYKRTARELKRIAGLGAEQRELERLAEEHTFELFHNPRLVDRRRLNAGVLCLFVTLVFFSLFSIVKAYVSIPSGVLTGLTVLACVCLLSFFVMVAPFDLPAFFDFEFLPDLHPPEELVDKPAGHAGPHRSATAEPYKDSRTVALMIESNVNDSQSSREDGRASAFLPQRASVAGNSAPIAVPQAVAPSVIPSITTGFGTNILQPIICSFWISGFAMFGSNTVIVQNLSQIFTSANSGVYDKSLNSLIVALTGIGSACGRILVGFAETYLHRRNALLREEQLRYQAQLAAGGAAGACDVTPVYHRWDSSVVFLMPLCPATMVVCAVLLVFVPVDAFPVVFFVCGIAMGGFLATFALGIREIFSCDVAKHYNFVASAGMLSSVVLNRVMFGMWYDKAAEDHKSDDGASCAGSACFSGSLFVLAGLNAVAVGSTFFIVYRWRNVRRTF